MSDLMKYQNGGPSLGIGSNVPIGVGAPNVDGSPNLNSFTAMSPNHGSQNPRLPYANVSVSYPSQVNKHQKDWR